MLKLERIYTQPFDFSGQRILVDRLWARGMAKKTARLDLWERRIAPSNELREWFNHDDHKYSTFKQRYLSELAANPATNEFVKTIQQIAEQHDIILLYGAKNAMHNNAVVVAEYLHEQIGIKIADRYHDFLHFYYNDGEANHTKKLPNDIQWLKQHPQIQNQLGVTFSNHYDHILHNGKSLAHDELFALAQQKLN